MKASILWLALALAAPDEAARARDILSAASRAYRAAPGWRDSLVYELKAPNAEPGRKRIDILMGSGTDVAVGDALFRATAVGGKLYLTKSGADTTYAVVPYRGDLSKALVALTGDRLSVFEPPPVAMRLGKSAEECLDSFRFNQLQPLQVIRAGRVNSDAGQTWDQIDLRAANGSVRARFDPRSHLLASIELRFTPQGAPPEVVVQIDGDFEPRAVANAATLVSFDPGSRHAVEGMAQLDSTRLPTGVPAKPFMLQTVGGGRISSADLRGRTVVIDFWATWCAPCWSALSEVQALARWAAKEKQPVTVLAIDTLERFPTEAERQSQVAALLRARSLDVPVALDEGNKVFDAFGSPGLPSTIVLGPDGTIRRYHQGLEAGLEATLRREVLEALSQDAGREP